MARILSVAFDQNEQLKRAIITTHFGNIKVEWENGQWFTTGNLEAKKLAVPVIERIERMVSEL
jgi:hypothetical protein